MTDETIVVNGGRNEGKTTKTLLFILDACFSMPSQNIVFWSLNNAHVEYCIELFIHLMKNKHPENEIKFLNKNTLVVKNNSTITFRSSGYVRDLKELRKESYFYSAFLVDHSVYEKWLYTPNL